MRKYLAVFILLLAVSVFAQDPDGLDSKELIENQQRLQGDYAITGNFAINWLSNYQALIWLATVCMVIFVALLYFAGNFLENEQIKQLGKTELIQAGATVLIVILFLGFIQAVDLILILTATEVSNPCLDQNFVPSEQMTLLNKYAACYMNNLNSLSVKVAEGSLKESISYASSAYRSVGGQSDSVYFGYLGYIVRPNAHMRLDSEIKRLEFSTLSSYIISLNGQQAFLGNIVPVLGPSAIILGLILRAFFFTRKLGGLLLATGFALMVVLPAMYLLSWYTLQVQAYGNQAVEDEDNVCPLACKILAPWGYNVNKNDGNTLAMGIKTDDSVEQVYGIYSVDGYGKLVEKRVQNKKEYISARNSLRWLDEENIQLCYPDKDTPYLKAVDSQNCGSECRILPMQAGLNCNSTACDMVPLACKAIRPMETNRRVNNGQTDLEFYCSSDVNSDFSCSCPDFCQIDLPQVKRVEKSADNPNGIEPTKNANDITGVNTKTFDCSTCPSQYRSYISDITPYTSVLDGQGNEQEIACEKCMNEKQDSETPDLMYGIPSIRNTECNKPSACGIALTIEEALNGANGNPVLGVCPIECRIDFSQGDPALKDPVYIEHCERTFAQACNKCSDHCKVDVRDVLNAQKTCEAPPRYYRNGDESKGACNLDDVNNGVCLLDRKVNENCARCPEPCRFENPSSVNYNLGVGLFLSSHHYMQQCEYIIPKDESQKILYSGTCQVDEFTDAQIDVNWYALQGNGDGLEPKVPACAPYPQVYRLASGQPKTCPSFVLQPKDDPGTQDEIEKELESINLQRPVYITGSPKANDMTANTFRISAMANPNVASICAEEDAQKYCQPQYCQPDKCIVDRADVGPAMCGIDISNQYSQVEDNDAFCTDCYKLNTAKTEGPQCQVYLSYEDTKEQKGILPAGCDSSCNPSTTDPKTQATCNGFCYPRLIVPSTANVCENYNSDTSGNEDRIVVNCRACPIECRYDYKVDVNGQIIAQISEEAAKECGLVAPSGENYGIKDAHNCDLKCRGVVPPQGTLDYDGGDFYTYCTESENYNCQEQTATKGIWVRSAPADQIPVPTTYPQSVCYKNVIANITSTHIKDQKIENGVSCLDEDKDKKCDNNWFEDLGCSKDFGYFATNTYYSCSPRHKYDGVDNVINSKYNLQGNDVQYFECGEINPANTDFNLCGEIGSGEGTINSAVRTAETCEDTRCNAQYNARAVECMEAEYFTADLGTTTQLIGAEENCNYCPYFCRAEDENGNSLCKDIPYVKCESPDNCDLRREQTSPPKFPNPISFCSIKLEEFKLPANKQPVPELSSEYCAWKQADETACPLRCRIELGQGRFSKDCVGGEIGNACSNLKQACTVDLPNSPCLPCSYCPIESCTYKPKVWTDCSLCSPENMNVGASAILPSDLVSSLSGAKATNTAWRNIGAIGIPAIVLPILGIITMLAFIRSISPILGGDIEIPGLMKLI